MNARKLGAAAGVIALIVGLNSRDAVRRTALPRDVGRRSEQRHVLTYSVDGAKDSIRIASGSEKQGSERGHRTGGQTIESVSDRRLHGVVGRYGRAAQQRPSRGQETTMRSGRPAACGSPRGYQARRQGPGLHVHHAGGVRREAKQG